VRSAIPSAILSALWAGVTACGATTTTTHIGGPCDSSNKCADGQICDRTNPGGQICIDANGDNDGDGIPNGKDFCEHMMGGANDEDGDGIGDECDACPIAPPPSRPDSDGDAVDSPCDPDTRTPGDKILLFNGFNAGVANAGADWKFQNGEAIVTPSGPGVEEELKLPLATATNHISIYAAYRIDGVAGAATQADAAVASATQGLPMGTSRVQCGGSRSSGSDAILLKSDSDGTSNQSTKPVTNVFNSAIGYRLEQQLDGANATCALAGDSEANSGAIQLTTDGNTPNQISLYARGATVRFSYILAVGQ
jgi:hypothetical protein